MRDTINILGVNIDMADLSQAEDIFWRFLDDGQKHMIFTPNAEIIMAAYKDDNLRTVLNKAHLLLADGIGVVYASRFLGKPLKERVAGFDLACRVIEGLAHKKYTLYLLGGVPGVAEQARQNLEARFNGINIVGTDNGYFDDDSVIINNINAVNPDILFVCLGAPRQELWIHNNIDKLNVKLMIGVGGSLDIFAGRAKRAPEFFQRLGLEWFYRLLKEPWRYKRMMALPKFALTVIFNSKK